MKNYPGTLYTITAPSGAGKTSLTSALMEALDNIKRSISYTTRPKRRAESAEDYHFIDNNQFDSMVKEHAFIEHAQVFGHNYGTSRQQVETQLEAGIDVILAIDWQGARQIRETFPAVISIFILPPSKDILKHRLRERNQDDEAVITKRLAQASAEVSHYKEFDYLVVNDIFNHALSDLEAIVLANRLSQKKQAIKYANLLAEWTEKA